MKKSILMSALLIGGLAAATPKISATTITPTMEQTQEKIKIDPEQLPDAVKNAITADESVANLSIAEAWQIPALEGKFHYKIVFDNGSEEKVFKKYDEAGNEIKE